MTANHGDNEQLKSCRILELSRENASKDMETI
jgi:hypothetical protein